MNDTYSILCSYTLASREVQVDVLRNGEKIATEIVPLTVKTVKFNPVREKAHQAVRRIDRWTQGTIGNYAIRRRINAVVPSLRHEI